MDELKDVIETLDQAADSFEGIATAEQKKIYAEVLDLVHGLDTKNGQVTQSISNLKKLTQIKAHLANLSKDKEWVAGIAGFAKYFGILQKQQNDYFSHAFPEHTLSAKAEEKNELMRQMAVQNTMEALMGDGLKANVTDKLNDILLRAVTSGAKFADLQEELRAHLLGKDGGQGAFARYATTYATTALSQYTGQHNKLITEDLDCDWFMYTGSTKETTREFCEQLVKKRYIHKSEIPTILTGKIDDYQCAIYPKTGLPLGMIEGTTPENFQCNCGGWNCRHQLVPVADALVPQVLRDKFKKIKPTAPQNEPTPAEQPLDLTPYQEQIGKIEKYIEAHPKSNKIKGFLAQAMGATNQADLEAILKAAISDMNKFDAAKKANEKKKEMLEQAKIDQESKAKAAMMESAIKFVQDNIVGKYGGKAYLDLWQKLSDSLKNGNPGGVYDAAAEMEALEQKIKNELQELVDPVALSHSYTWDQLAGANKYVSGHLNTWGSKGKTGEALIKAIDDEINKYMDKTHPTYDITKDAFEKKKAEIKAQMVKDDFLKKKWKITDYIQAHPKAGKVIDAYNKMVEAEKAGRQEEANGYANIALGIIKKNEGVAEYLKKKNGKSEESTQNLVDLTKGNGAGYFEKEDEYRIKMLRKCGAQLYNELTIGFQTTDASLKKDVQKYIQEFAQINSAKDENVDWDAFEKIYIETLKKVLDAKDITLSERWWCPKGESDIEYYNFIVSAGTFSVERKKKAAIFSNDQSAFDFTYEHTNFRSTWKKATEDQKDANDSYTSNSCAITRLLRGISGWHEESEGWAKRSEREINALTELIKATKSKYDLFVKRDERHAFCDYRWKVNLESYQDHMQDLIGKIGTDESFMSCGNNKNTKFGGTGKTDVELRIFCPKGTQMMPEEPQSALSVIGKHWDGNKKPSSFNENEIILQRGSKLRITNAKYDRDKHYYYISCEVISQNPRDFDVEYTPGQGYKAAFK